MSHIVCWNCGRDLADMPRPITRHNNCPECFSDLHCCRLCKHFMPERVGICAEDRADPPVEKDNANFCSFFIPTSNAFNPKTKTQGDAAKDALADLFGSAPASQDAAQQQEPSDPTPTDSTIDAVNELFKPKK